MQLAAQSQNPLITHVKGFTFIELLIVIVILGFISVIVSPKFLQKSEFDEYLFQQDVMSSVRYAQRLAVASGCDLMLIAVAAIADVDIAMAKASALRFSEL